MNGDQLTREDSSLKSVSAQRRKKAPVVLKLYLSEEEERILDLFKKVAKERFFGKSGWQSKALLEAMELYVKRYGKKRQKVQRREIKLKGTTKRVIRDFFTYIISFYKCLQPGLKRNLIYHFLEEIGIGSRTSKYRYLRRMLDLGLVIYAYTDFDKEPVYRIDWDEVFRMFPELEKPGLRRVEW